MEYHGPRRVVSTGRQVPEHDGHHVWIVVIGHHIKDPSVFLEDSTEAAIMDADNYIGMDGPFCHYCRANYTREIGYHCAGRPTPT